jgi:hypothetical protein
MDAGEKSRYAIYCLHKRTREYVDVLAHAPAVEAVAPVSVPMAIESNEKMNEKEASGVEQKEKEKCKNASANANEDDERSSVKEAASASNTANKNRADRHTRATTQRMSTRRQQKNATRKAVFQDAGD